jgi:beta-phosphoglucomutase-like phosphatase (HAD superfamily)
MHGTIRAWIFDWDGIFVDSEKWKAWTYGLGLRDIYPEVASLAATRFDPQQPQAHDPFLQACGHYVGKSRQEYVQGLVGYYDARGLQLSARLSHVAAEWEQIAPDRIQQIAWERRKTGMPFNAPVEPWEVMFELRRPYYERYQNNVEPIAANVEFLVSLSQDAPAGLVTRTPEDRVRALMERFAIPAGRFGVLTCRPEKDVSKAQMYEITASRLGIRLDLCAAVEDTETGVRDAERAGSSQGQRMALIIACPTPMTAVQEFGAADLVVHGGLLKLRALAGALGQMS